jgi:hypothetical protein
MLRLLVGILLVFLMVGLLPAWPYSAHWGYFPSSGALILLIVCMVLLTGQNRSLV